MSEKLPRPFRSAVSDYAALLKRWREIGTSIPGSEHGVDVTPKPAPAEDRDPGHCPGYFG